MADLEAVIMQKGEDGGIPAASYPSANGKIQAIAAINPDTLLPIDFATQTTLAALVTAVQLVKDAVDNLNTKTQAVNTGAIAGAVSVTNQPSGLATEATLINVKNVLDALSGNTDTIETLQTAANNSLAALAGYNDSVESLLTAIGSNSDGLESLLTTLGVQTDQIEPLLADIKSAIENMQAGITLKPADIADLKNVNAVTSNITGKFREAFESYTPGVKWLETKASGDLVYVDGNAAAASYLVISKSPLNAGTETSIETIDTVTMPVELSFGAHLSQRTLGQEFSFELVDTEPPLADVPELNISSISQATTTLTINFSGPHNLSVGKSIGVRGVSDSRLNYPSLVVATVPTTTQITCTAGPMGNIPSLTIAAINNSGAVYFRERLGRANDGVSQIFENASVTNASLYVRSESGDAFPSGTVAGNHSATINTTASVQLINAANTYAFTPTTEYRIVTQADLVQWYDSAVDTTGQLSNRLKRTQVCPSPSKSYKLRIRATNNKALTVPIAQIVSVTKSGSTTATIVFDRAHGLTTSDQIVAYGVRDQTNFANLTAATAIASIVNTTTITCIWGASVTATSYGGYAARVNGGNLMSALGAIAQVASTATLTNGILTLVGNAAWASLLIGDSVELVGLRDNTTGATLNIDGAWRVMFISTTNLYLEPLGFTAPANFTVTNCGGGVIRRTDLRISFVRIFDYERERVEMLAKPAGDSSNAVPVVLQVNPTVTSNEGTPFTPSSNIINSAASTNGTVVKASAGNVYAVRASNNGAAAAYVKLHNSTTVTVGTTAVADWLLVPAGSSALLDYGDKGVRFGTGVCLSITGAVGDTDTTAVALGQVKVVTSFA